MQTGWHVVYTKPRREHLAEQNLLRQGYEVWLPTIGKWTICAADGTCDTQRICSRTTDPQRCLTQVCSTLALSSRGCSRSDAFARSRELRPAETCGKANARDLKRDMRWGSHTR